jgi:folylpolyglutamate synthase/dihydrofolate synthase
LVYLIFWGGVKGSVCAYITSALHAAGVSVGRFTTPHLIHRSDSITIRNSPVPLSLFDSAEASILTRNTALGIDASEFELLTATAFEIFSRAGVDVGVVEVGLGGAEDATNVLLPHSTLVSVVTKIGLDHQKFLGDTLEEIAKAKAGIAKSGVPLVIDGSNLPNVLDVVKTVVDSAGAGPMVLAVAEDIGREDVNCTVETKHWGLLKFKKFLPGDFQRQNLSVAISALSCIALRFPSLTPGVLTKSIADTTWPGRLEKVDISSILKLSSPTLVLFDGAHNIQAQAELRKYVDAHIRPTADNKKIVWVLAATKGKDVEGMVKELVQRRDTVVATEFGSVDGMPWVQAVDGEAIVNSLSERVEKGVSESDSVEAVRVAWELANDSGATVVVAGSLYVLTPPLVCCFY